MVGPVVVTTTAPEEMTTMTKVQDRAAVALAKEALLADREGLKELFRSMLQEVLEAEMTEAIGASRGERTEGRLGYRSGYYTRGLIRVLGRLSCVFRRTARGDSRPSCSSAISVPIRPCLRRWRRRTSRGYQRGR